MCSRCLGSQYNEFDSGSDLTDLDTDSLEDSTSSGQYSENSSLSEASGEDSASDCGVETTPDIGQPATKRARVAETGTVPAEKSFGRREKTPDLNFAVPADILLEIFSHLEPVDLLHLFCTSKAFRKVLSSENALSVWKTARVNHGGVPDCLPGMSEVGWANLLFGSSECQECGRKRTWQIDFGIRRRVCSPCLDEHLVLNSVFAREFPKYNPIIMDLIPFSSVGTSGHCHILGSCECKFFWSDDVVEMAEKLEAYLKPGTEQALEDFKQSRKKYVDLNMEEHITVCTIWADEYGDRQLSHTVKLRSQNKKLFQARLVNLGHGAKDVERMFDRRHYGVLDRELTDARWERLIPKVEHKLAELQEEWRLEDQRNASSSRRSELFAMYQKYVRQLPQAFIPHPKIFLELRDVAEFINSPPTEDKENNVQPCCAFAERIYEFCAEYIHKKKLELTRLLALSTNALQNTSILHSRGINVPYDMLVQLATSVFQCSRSGTFPLITWDKVQYHRCSPYNASMVRKRFMARNKRFMVQDDEILASTSSCTFSISQGGVSAAHSLLSMVGLDAQTTTATTMDNLQCRFFCSNCPPKPENGGSYRLAMNWRQGVFHYVKHQDHPSHKEPCWELLSAAQLQEIQSSRTDEYPGATQQVWRCNKCDKYHERPTTKVPVINHVQSHGITAPTEGIDFSYDQRVVEKPPPATKFFVTPQTNKPSKSKPSTPLKYRCQHCEGSRRKFILEGVKEHNKNKHKINSPSEGPDFYKIK